MFANPKRSCYQLAAILCALTTIGCGKATLTGNVIYKGKPVTSGTVTVFDESGASHQGGIHEDGSYTITGIPRGSAQIMVTSPDPNAATKPPKDADKDAGSKTRQHNAEQKGQGTPVQGWRKIPDKYGDVATSGLTIEVRSGPNTYDIALSD